MACSGEGIRATWCFHRPSTSIWTHRIRRASLSCCGRFEPAVEEAHVVWKGYGSYCVHEKYREPLSALPELQHRPSHDVCMYR